MTASKNSGATSQPLLLSDSPSSQSPPQYVVDLPPYPPPHRHILLRKSCQRCLFCFAIFLVLLVAAGYVLWPYNPELSIVSLRLDRLRFHRESEVLVDVIMDLKVKVLNPAVYSLDYDSLVVAIGYRGERLGFVTSDGGRIKARGSSFVNATLHLDRVEVLSDVVSLTKDLEKGAVTFGTVLEIGGKLGIFSTVELPLKAQAECGVTVSTWNQTIIRQSCYPEVTEI